MPGRTSHTDCGWLSLIPAEGVGTICPALYYSRGLSQWTRGSHHVRHHKVEVAEDVSEDLKELHAALKKFSYPICNIDLMMDYESAAHAAAGEGAVHKVQKKDLWRRATIEAKMREFSAEMTSPGFGQENINSYLDDMSAFISHKANKKN